MKKVCEELAKLKSYWHERIAGLTVETPDAELNSTLNMWGPFNCLITYAWSRAASLIYAGERDGLGFRDTVQDMLGVMHTIPEEAGQRSGIDDYRTGFDRRRHARSAAVRSSSRKRNSAARRRVPLRRLLVAFQCDSSLREGDRRR